MPWVTGAEHSTWWRLPGDCSGWGCFSLMEAGCLVVFILVWRGLFRREAMLLAHLAPLPSTAVHHRATDNEDLIKETLHSTGPGWATKQRERAGLRNGLNGKWDEKRIEGGKRCWGEKGCSPFCIVMLQFNSQSILLLVKKTHWSGLLVIETESDKMRYVIVNKLALTV